MLESMKKTIKRMLYNSDMAGICRCATARFLTIATFIKHKNLLLHLTHILVFGKNHNIISKQQSYTSRVPRILLRIGFSNAINLKHNFLNIQFNHSSEITDLMELCGPKL
jgi:hypothetical protein